MSKKGTDQAIPTVLVPPNPQAWNGMKGHMFALLRFCYILKENFTAHQCSLRASALTYITLLSMIPVLAIAFSVLKGLGAQNALEPILRNVAGNSQEAVSRIIDYVNNTNFKSLGAIGVLALVTTSISLFGNIEVAFNTAWDLKETRPLRQRFSYFLSVIVVAPILILAGASLTSDLQRQWVVKWLIGQSYVGETILFAFRLIPYVSIWGVLVFLYISIPNTKVQLRSAILGGVLAGTAWQIAQWGYYHFQIGVAKYNAIYGTLAALPVFLVWIYTSWLIVLCGVEIVRIHQSRAYSVLNLHPEGESQAAEEERTLALLIHVCEYFQKKNVHPTAASLAEELSLHQNHVEDILKTLRDLGYVISTSDNPPVWLPAFDPCRMEIGRLLSRLRGVSVSDDTFHPAMILAGNLIRRDAERSLESFSALTMSDLLNETTDEKEETS